MNRSEKAAIIEQIRSRAASASIAVVTDFKGMSVEELTRLRVALRNSGGEYHVVKNTLARIALSDTAHASIKDDFKDNCAIALGFDDPVAVAKNMSAAQVEALAALPSKDQLLAQVLGTMNAVPTNFVSLMANMIRPLLYALKAIEEKKAA